MTDPRIRRAALSALRDGRVTIRSLQTANDGATRIIATVESSRPERAPHTVDLMMFTGWTCTCRNTDVCAHIAAVQLVTGHPSAAAKEPK